MSRTNNIRGNTAIEQMSKTGQYEIRKALVDYGAMFLTLYYYINSIG